MSFMMRQNRDKNVRTENCRRHRNFRNLSCYHHQQRIVLIVNGYFLDWKMSEVCRTEKEKINALQTCYNLTRYLPEIRIFWWTDINLSPFLQHLAPV